MDEKKPPGTFVVDKNAIPATKEGMCLAYTGKTLNELISDIHNNIGGEFDCLYSD